MKSSRMAYIAFCIAPLFSVACNSAPSPQCLDIGLDIMQQGGFSDTANKEYCDYANMMAVMQSNNNCRASDIFPYIAKNAESVIKNSVLAGLPDEELKKESERWSKAARSLVEQCKLK